MSKKPSPADDLERIIADILTDEMNEFGLTSKAYFRSLKERLLASDPHYVSHKGSWVRAYTTPAWKIREAAAQELAPQVGIKKPVDEHEVNINQPVVVQIIEQPGCPEVPRKGKVRDPSSTAV